VSSDEDAKVALLRRVLEAPSPAVELGIGDDAAVLRFAGAQLVWSIDAAVEGVHFSEALMSLEDAGYRATTAALSDLAAMGARPLGVLAALELPRSFSDAKLEALARGQRAAVDRVGTSVIGGNLARSEQLCITTTVLGVSERALTRGGARAGDELWLAGPVGLAAAGLAAARLGLGPAALSPSLVAALEAFRRPTARFEAGLAAVQAGATAGLDVSDGTARDARRLAEASRVTLAFEASKLVGDTLQRAAAELALDPLELALSGGEDYALLVTAPRGVILEGFVRVGRCEQPAEAPVVVELSDGTRCLARGGWDHFG
jgi:thiamine-monophosphate kinase